MPDLGPYVVLCRPLLRTYYGFWHLCTDMQRFVSIQAWSESAQVRGNTEVHHASGMAR